MDSRVFVIGRDQVPQLIRLGAGESLRWTFVALPPREAVALPGRLRGDKTSASLHPSQTGVWAPPVCGTTGGYGFPAPQPAGVPGTSLRVDLEVDLEGPGAEADLAGLYLCDGDQRLEFNILVRHSSGGCTSHQLFKGIAGEHSRTSFDGLIYVAEGARKTKAYQENHNILLSPDAIVESKPQLEIYADDVECSHGATTGFLNADELFYMRSRGIPEAEARRLQMISFIAPVLARLPEDLQEEVIAAI